MARHRGERAICPFLEGRGLANSSKGERNGLHFVEQKINPGEKKRPERLARKERRPDLVEEEGATGLIAACARKRMKGNPPKKKARYFFGRRTPASTGGENGQFKFPKEIL